MLILDTDYISLLEERTSGEGQWLRSRLASSGEDVVTTIITYEEQTRGWLAHLAKAKTVVQEVGAYRLLRRHLETYRDVPVLDFDELAAIEYQRWKHLRVRIGTMDLKIAAIAIAHHGVLLSRNLRDFRRVPDLVVENWLQ